MSPKEISEAQNIELLQKRVVELEMVKEGRLYFEQAAREIKLITAHPDYVAPKKRKATVAADCRLHDVARLKGEIIEVYPWEWRAWAGRWLVVE